MTSGCHQRRLIPHFSNEKTHPASRRHHLDGRWEMVDARSSMKGRDKMQPRIARIHAKFVRMDSPQSREDLVGDGRSSMLEKNTATSFLSFLRKLSVYLCDLRVSAVR
jgi:hypothetical protein